MYQYAFSCCSITLSLSLFLSHALLPFRSVDKWLMANQGKGKSKRSLSQLMRQVINIWDSIMIQSSTFLNGVVMNLNHSVCWGSVVSLQLWGKTCAEDATGLLIRVCLWSSTEIHRRGPADVHMDACGGDRLQVGFRSNHLTSGNKSNLILWVKSNFDTFGSSRLSHKSHISTAVIHQPAVYYHTFGTDLALNNGHSLSRLLYLHSVIHLNHPY